ncbi:MAG: hypothetical protein HY098_02590 [Nitrospinae bacterium]|nr:hypothetical protein [Nitrospinota bacterium]
MNRKQVIQEILDSAQKLSLEKERIRGIFQKSGVVVDFDMRVTAVNGDPTAVIKVLMDNLTEMAVVKISAKQVLRRAGLTI